METVKKLISKPVASGVIGGVGAGLMFGMGDVALPFGLSLPVPVVYGVVIGGSSAINSAYSEVIMPLFKIDDPLSQMAQMVVAPAVTGGITVGISTVLNGGLPTAKGALGAFGLGAVSEIGGYYVMQAVSQ